MSINKIVRYNMIQAEVRNLIIYLYDKYGATPSEVVKHLNISSSNLVKLKNRENAKIPEESERIKWDEC